MKCFTCEDEMDEIVSYLDTNFYLKKSDKKCGLFVCISKDCKDSGTVRCLQRNNWMLGKIEDRPDE